MKQVLIDTNVLVSFLTDRNQEQQEHAARLLESAATGQLEVVLHQAVVFELAYVLLNLYGREPAEVRSILEELLALPGVTAVERLPWGEVFDLWPHPFPDLADAALAAACRELRCDEIATFDRRFVRRLRQAGLHSVW